MSNTVRVKVVKTEGASATTQQIYEDPFQGMYESDDIIQPPYSIRELKQIAEYSTILQQCIEAYITNIVQFGLTPQYAFDYRAADEITKSKADVEWERLRFFLKYLNFDEIPETILSWALADREKTGSGYLEVLRNGRGEPCSIEYMDCTDVRVTKYTSPVNVDFVVMENNVPKSITVPKRFRRFVQIRGNKKVFFKEYGDPRILNKNTGEFVVDATSIGEEDIATEVIHFKIGPEAYGKPRYLGNIISLYGARKAEELNYYYFKQGRHVPAAVIVENGQLTDSSFNEIQEYMKSVEGVDNAHKFLLLEAEGIESKNFKGEEDITPVKVQIKSLAEMLQQDALFLEYDTKTRDKLRSAFRLPPLYTGESQDYNKATAQTAKQVTEEQVFVPQRNALSGKLTTMFCQSLQLHYVSITLKGPNTSDPIEKAKAIIPLLNGGGIVPNDLRDLAAEILGKDLEPLTYEGADDKPFQLLVAANKSPVINSPAVIDGAATPVAKSYDKDIINVLKNLQDYLEELHAK
ncbi:phage portal protein [Bacillus sp. NPDC077411]|uniref:phage portal protein n=1 Tax=Bacillus sp. NPDC077411 TaxID=3363947 RepID=UPI0037C8D6D8